MAQSSFPGARQSPVSFPSVKIHSYGHSGILLLSMLYILSNCRLGVTPTSRLTDRSSRGFRFVAGFPRQVSPMCLLSTPLQTFVVYLLKKRCKEGPVNCRLHNARFVPPVWAVIRLSQHPPHRFSTLYMERRRYLKQPLQFGGPTGS